MTSQSETDMRFLYNLSSKLKKTKKQTMSMTSTYLLPLLGPFSSRKVSLELDRCWMLKVIKVFPFHFIVTSLF